jgi:hypothetical protein
MIRDKLAPAVFTEIILRAVIFFPVPDYVTDMSSGAFEFYGD